MNPDPAASVGRCPGRLTAEQEERQPAVLCRTKAPGKLHHGVVRIDTTSSIALRSPWHETALVNSTAGDLADADTTSPAFRHDPPSPFAFGPWGLPLKPQREKPRVAAKSSSQKRVGGDKACTTTRPAAGPSLPTCLHLAKIELAENSERRAG
ncbi:hypothetical protein Landi51_10192 [Colletotrichum acutatum]